MIHNQMNNIINVRDQSLENISKEIAKAVREELQASLKRFWYGTYEPTSYKRTWELFNSVFSKVEKTGRCNYVITVGFDPDKMRAVKNDKGWNTHMGFDSQKFTEGLITSVENGMRGSLANPRHGDAAGMIDFTRRWAAEYAKDILSYYLR